MVKSDLDILIAVLNELEVGEEVGRQEKETFSLWFFERTGNF